MTSPTVTIDNDTGLFSITYYDTAQTYDVDREVLEQWVAEHNSQVEHIAHLKRLLNPETAEKRPIDLPGITEQALGNSRRWFPELHARGLAEQIIHQTLGLAGEAGEVANVVKKANRAGWQTKGIRIGTSEVVPHYEIVSIDNDAADELADVLTYLLNLAGLLGVDLVEAFHRKQAICEERWG
jgi:NTP pyrophosphatase (non-canonical NTP hydrolase)